MRQVSRRLLVVLALLPCGQRAFARCTKVEEAHDVMRAAEQAARCNYQTLRGARDECLWREPPACSGSLVEQTMALVYGENNPPQGPVDLTAMSGQLECQRIIGSASARFIGLDLYYLMLGLSAVDADV